MIRMEADDLVNIISRVGTTDRDESVAALLRENNALKGKLDEVERSLAQADSRSNMRVMAAEQKREFPAVHAEQLRIVKTIRKVLPKKAASSLLFKLAMGDIGDLK